MKRLKWRLMAAVFGTCALASAAGAFQTSDSLTVTITPSASYAVKVETAQAFGYLNMGAVGLGQTTETVVGSTIAVYSTYLWTGLSLQGQITATGTPWTFDSNAVSYAR